MRRKKQLLDNLDEFLECGKIKGECLLNGDFKRG